MDDKQNNKSLAEILQNMNVLPLENLRSVDLNGLSFPNSEVPADDNSDKETQNNTQESHNDKEKGSF